MTKIFVSADFYKSHVAAYTKKDGTFVAEHEDKRRKHADVKPEHLYGMLADAEDSGGRAAVHELAHDVIQHRPDLERAVRGAASDVGHSLPTRALESSRKPADDHRLDASSKDSDRGSLRSARRAPYHRFTNGGPMNKNVGHAMFADGDPERVEHYGRNYHSFDPQDLPDAAVIDSDNGRFVDALRSALENSGDWSEKEIDSLLDEASPDDIVDTAGLWDDQDLVSLVWEKVMEPNGWLAVKTPDGAIVFDESAIRSHGDKNDIEDYGTLKKSHPPLILFVKSRP